jgi:hypothetical protein
MAPRRVTWLAIVGQDISVLCLRPKSSLGKPAMARKGTRISDQAPEHVLSVQVRMFSFRRGLREITNNYFFTRDLSSIHVQKLPDRLAETGSNSIRSHSEKTTTFMSGSERHSSRIFWSSSTCRRGRIVRVQNVVRIADHTRHWRSSFWSLHIRWIRSAVPRLSWIVAHFFWHNLFYRFHRFLARRP